jgi:hypothetical protein
MTRRTLLTALVGSTSGRAGKAAIDRYTTPFKYGRLVLSAAPEKVPSTAVRWIVHLFLRTAASFT